MICDQASRIKWISFLKTYFSTSFFKYKQRVLTKNNNIRLLSISIEMQSKLSSLFTNVGNPAWFHLWLRIIFRLILLLLFNVIISECFHWRVVVALNFQIAVGNDEASRVLWVKKWSRNKIISQLDLEKDGFIIDDNESSIYRLNTHLFIGWVSAKLSMYKVIRIPIKLMWLQLCYLRKSICWFDKVDAEDSGWEDG